MPAYAAGQRHKLKLSSVDVYDAAHVVSLVNGFMQPVSQRVPYTGSQRVYRLKTSRKLATLASVRVCIVTHIVKL